MTNNSTLWLRSICAISRKVQSWPGSWRLNQFLYHRAADIATIGSVVLSPRQNLSIEVTGETSVNILIESLAIQSPAIQLLEQLSEAGACIIDVGANIGLVSILLSQRVGNNGHIHSFEALPATAELLQRNLNRNQCNNVTIHPYAVSNQCGEITFYNAGPGKTEVSSLRPRPGHAITVPTITLDTMMPELSPVNVIKVDVEGAEYLVLDGMRRLLARDCPHLVVEVTDQWSQQLGFRASDVGNLLKNLGYRLFILENKELQEIISPPEKQTDVVALHISKAEAVLQRWSVHQKV